MISPRRKIACNHAYIDGANLHKGTVALGWRIDYKKFYIWLHEKHHIKRAYIFIGYIPAFDKLYSKMSAAGFLIRFKQTIKNDHGEIKGNCDADLVLRSVQDIYESVFDKAIIVSSDGDFSSLVDVLLQKGKMHYVLSPNKKCSTLLMNTGVPLTYLHDIRELISLKK